MITGIGLSGKSSAVASEEAFRGHCESYQVLKEVAQWQWDFQNFTRQGAT